jgi:hypothetical protein
MSCPLPVSIPGPSKLAKSGIVTERGGAPTNQELSAACNPHSLCGLECNPELVCTISEKKGPKKLVLHWINNSLKGPVAPVYGGLKEGWF